MPRPFTLRLPLLAPLAILLLSGCAPTYKFTQIDATKSVAIVSYSAVRSDEQTSKGIVVQFDSGQAKKNAVIAYDRLGKALSEKFGWTVHPYSTVAGHPAYAKVYQAVHESSWLMKQQFVGKNDANHYHPKGIFFPVMMGSVEPAQLESVYENLGVDAVAVATVGVTESRENHIFSPDELVFSTVMNFRVYRRGQEDPVWKDHWIEAEHRTRNGDTRIGPFQFNGNRQKAFLAAIQMGYKVLLARYDEALAKAKAEKK